MYVNFKENVINNLWTTKTVNGQAKPQKNMCNTAKIAKKRETKMGVQLGNKEWKIRESMLVYILF